VLRYRWPATSADLPLHPFGADPLSGPTPLFEIGHGLRTAPWSGVEAPT
jgi:hypothetical protein